MKLRNLFLGLLLCATAASAQDVITKTDGSRIDAKVEEITEQTVRYRKASNPTGPVYSIPVTSILTITYENGSVDNFNAPEVPSAPVAQTPTYPAAVSNNYYQNQDFAQSSAMNDAQLLRISDSFKSLTPKELRKKAKIYKIVGWTGGAALLVAGLGIAFIGYDNINYYHYQRLLFSVGGAAIGAGWCLGFNLKANSMIKRANEIEMMSANIIEDKIFSIGDKPLIAGINVMNNQTTRTHGIGVSLKLNF